jgi:hypothetical protein
LRAFEHEPIEKGGQPTRDRDNAYSSPNETATTPVIEPASQHLVRADKPALPKEVMDYPGTLRTRRQVERLQVRLTNGTPLQDYQIRALIVALDDLHAQQAEQSESREVNQALANERMLQVASDILFESQLEKFMEMLREKGIGDSGWGE